MTVTSTQHSARIRFIDRDENSIQSISRLKPNLNGVQIRRVMEAVNAARRISDSAVGGYYTVSEQLQASN